MAAAGTGARAGAIELAALLAEADARNPQLMAARARLRAVGYVPSQVEALPDPTVSVAYTNETLTRVTLGSSTDSDLTLSWTQEQPYPGKRRLAGDVARAEIRVGGLMLESARLGVRAEVAATYADLYRLGKIEEILRESQKLLDAFLGTVRARYEGGRGILENVIRAQTERTKLDVRLATTAQERESTERSLAALLGRSGIEPVGSATALPQVRIPDRISLLKAASDLAPDLKGFHAAADREEARLGLARRGHKPDFVWEAAYMNRGGLDPMIMGKVGVRLPVYGKRKQAQAVAQAMDDLEAARLDMKARETGLHAEVGNILARAERARSLVLLYAEGLLPQSQSALDAAAAAYASEQTEFITLIEDFRAALDVQIQYETERAELVKAVASLETLTGLTLVLAPARSEASSVQGEGHE